MSLRDLAVRLLQRGDAFEKNAGGRRVTVTLRRRDSTAPMLQGGTLTDTDTVLDPPPIVRAPQTPGEKSWFGAGLGIGTPGSSDAYLIGPIPGLSVQDFLPPETSARRFLVLLGGDGFPLDAHGHPQQFQTQLVHCEQDWLGVTLYVQVTSAQE